MLKRILAFHAKCCRFARKQQRRNLRFKSKVLDQFQPMLRFVMGFMPFGHAAFCFGHGAFAVWTWGVFISSWGVSLSVMGHLRSVALAPAVLGKALFEGQVTLMQMVK